MRSLEGKVKIYDKLIVCLLEDIGFNNGILELFLQDKVFLLESFQGIKFIVGYESSQEDLSESSRSQNLDDVE